VLDKHGKPEDIASGIKGSSVPLPPTPLSGMYNKYGGKTRLTFKLDQDELWIGTKGVTFFINFCDTNISFLRILLFQSVFCFKSQTELKIG